MEKIDLFEQIVKGLEGCVEKSQKNGGEKLVKTVKVKPELSNIYAKYVLTGKQLIELKDKLVFLKKKFWVLAEEEAGLGYDRMYYNVEKETIECFKKADSEEKEKVDIEKELSKKTRGKKVKK